MGFDLNEPEQRRKLRAALKASDLTPGEIWLNYFSIGGGVGEYEVEAYLQGLLSLPPIQRDLLAMAANELIEAIPASMRRTPMTPTWQNAVRSPAGTPRLDRARMPTPTPTPTPPPTPPAITTPTAGRGRMNRPTRPETNSSPAGRPLPSCGLTFARGRK